MRNLFILVISLSALATTVRGDLIRFTFEGEIVTVAGTPGVFTPSLGDSFSFSYVFDSELMDSDSDPNFGSFSPAMLSAPTLTVDGTTVDMWSTSDITVINSDIDGDSYTANVSDGAGLAASIEVLDSTGMALGSDALPLMLELSDFDAVAGYVFFAGDGEGSESGFIQAHISTFSSVVLPVPGAVWMGFVGLGLVVIGRKFVL